MASIIPGYEYDIFISYRQKDNKHDGWVTEFVDNLKGELESTFKEEISVYFDINPSDYLLETYDVDASLKDKLKCLVFIPIISRTYCDPKSFAWEHEFKAFVEQASKDQFGLKVKLPNGNVASRVLPIRIYDLDTSDIKLCESVLGGVLRSVDFIYKSAGVNRPLRANEDHPQDNLNKTYYRDQINKVANSIKEIITSIGQHEQKHDEVKKEIPEPVSVTRKINKTRIIIGALILLALIALGILVVPKLFKPSEQLKKSIAVLPFLNFSEDLNQELRSDALTNEIINHLYKIKSIDRVAPFPSVLVYRKRDKKNTLVADELNVNYLLDGTYQRIGDSLKITANLIEPKSDKYLWQNDYYEPYKEIISIQSDIALQIASHVNAFLTVTEKQNIQKTPTINQEAYELVQQVIYLWNTEGGATLYHNLDSILKAIQLDPDYADAYAWAGTVILMKGSYSGSSEMQSVVWDATSYFDKALELDQSNSAAHYGLSLINNWIRWDYIKAEKEFLKALELEPNNPVYINAYFEWLVQRNLLDDALTFSDKTKFFDRLIDLFILSGNKKEAYNFIRKYLETEKEQDNKRLGECFIWLEVYDSAKIHLESALKSEDSQMSLPRFQACLALVYHKTKSYLQAKAIVNQLTEKIKETSAGSPEYFAGWYYSGIGEIDSAFYYLEEAYKKRSLEMPWLKVDPVFKNIKGDPRYQDLYVRTGHKAYDDFLKSAKKAIDSQKTN